MMRRLPLVSIVAFAGFLVRASAQRFVAYVPTSEATITGALLVSGSNSILGESSIVSALDRPAHVILSRGGTVLVCQASAVHLLVGHGTPDRSGQSYDPILVSLEKGSLELRMPMISTDAVVTAGMRFSSAARHNKPDLLDLAMRVSPNGDTCVENRGKKSPPINITDALGQSSYLLKPDQHVVFAHGLIQEASPAATTSCGCPPAPAQGMSLADAALRAGAGNTATFDQNASAFPFPTAVSRGIESPEPLPPENPNQTRVKVSGTLVYEAPALTPAAELDAALAPRDDLAPPPTAGLAAPGRRKLVMLPAPPKPAVVASAARRPVEHESGPESDPKPKKSGIGGFFKKIFGGG